MKTAIKLVALALALSILPCFMHAMEEFPRKNEHSALPYKLLDPAIQALSQASVGNYEELRLLFSKDATANQIYNVALDQLWRIQRLRSIDQNKQEAFLIKLATFLFDFGFNVNAREKGSNCSPLGLAIEYRFPALAHHLIAHGADLETKETNEQFTPLLQAIANDQLELTEYLIEQGANIHAVDGLGRNALELACSEEIFKLLIKKGAPIKRASILQALFTDNCTDIAKFLKLGVDPNIELESTELEFVGPPLFIACMRPLFLEATRIAHPETPKNLALEQANRDFIQLLLNYDANTDKRDPQGATALMYLAGLTPSCIQKLNDSKNPTLAHAYKTACQTVNMTQFAKLLLDHGANRDLKNNEGQTARDIAESHGNTAMVELLDSHNLWGASGLKLKSARAVLAQWASMDAQDVQQVMSSMPEHLRDAIILIAPKAIKDKIGVEADKNSN